MCERKGMRYEAEILYILHVIIHMYYCTIRSVPPLRLHTGPLTVS
jgi:hypothetical protein